jgi:hypothetical protein
MTMAEQAKIAALDGPYLVKDPVVVDAEGNEFRSEHETIALCRCGGADEAVLRRHQFEGRPPGGGEGRQRGGMAGTLKNQEAFRQLQQELALKNDPYKEDERTWQGHTPGS